MYDNLRLTELHEEWAVAREREARYARYLPRLGAKTEADLLDAEIRARVARQTILEDKLPAAVIPAGTLLPLRFGISDAVRAYPRRANPLVGWPVEHYYPPHWTNHARHALPVAGCHLCQDARKISAAIREGL